MTDYEKLGSFYLGRHHDLAAGETFADRPLLYDSKDLTTHAVCVGMTGSGKTGLCLGLLEEAAIDGVPAIAIDPKGDLGNLLLAFPQLDGTDFRPWIDEGEARRKGIAPDELAEQRAQLWREGLATWDQGPDRVQRYCDAVERIIYTPASSAGIPLTVMKSFSAPPPEVLDDADSYRDRVSGTASGLLALLGIDADPVKSREHIFVSNVLDTAWKAGRSLDLPELIREIRDPSFQRVGVMDLETFFPAKDRTELSLQLNNLLASPSFASWMEGESLDIKRLLYNSEGKPRLSIISIAHLSDAERMFFVTILLNEMLAWMRTQPGTSSLRALLYMDEVFGYFPPQGNPPSKKPMLTLLKQARAFGLGCMLATQNPVDLDYKGLSNAGTWFLGRLQTERDKMRVMEGLEGASAQAGTSFNRREMEATLAGLGSRRFLMNNVHQSQPIVFETRWVLSFLRGPLTRLQIKKLMDPVRDRFMAAADADDSGSLQGRDSQTKEVSAAAISAGRPVLPAGIEERFAVVVERLPRDCHIEYRPGLVGEGKLHFVSSQADLDEWVDCCVVKSSHVARDADSVWDDALTLANSVAVSEEPEFDGTFGDVPSDWAQPGNYRNFARQLKSHLYRSETCQLWYCESADQYSEVGEEESAFRRRLGPQLGEALARAQEKLEKTHASKRKKQEQRVERCQADVEKQRSQFLERIASFLWAVMELFLSHKAGRATSRRTTTSMSRARAAVTERGQQSRAQQKLEAELEELDEILAQQEEEREQLSDSFDVDAMPLEKVEVKPRKGDIEVGNVQLVWLPYRLDGDGDAIPVY